MQNDFPDGKYVKCRVLGNSRFKATLELSMRDSRVEKGNLEDDLVPKPDERIHAYVVSTTKVGCFVRLSRSVEGRVILKELSDDFIPNPQHHFPAGRLVAGKVKHVKKSNQSSPAKVDIDMRESILLSSGKRLTIDDIKEKSKYTGVITRVESYGVFVRIDNSDVSGLAHVSECSDNFIKNIFNLYNPGDFVKVIVISMDEDQKRLGFSLKASNFVDDDDSDDDSTSSNDSESSSNVNNDDDSKEQSTDSEDEDFASKLAKKMTDGEGMDVDEESRDTNSSEGSSDSSEGSSSGSESESSDSEGEEDEAQNQKQEQSVCEMETDVGFDWGNATKRPKTRKLVGTDDESASSNSSEDESDDADNGVKSSHKSKKKAAAKRREEEETSRREQALADGTADETPETSADFER